MTQLNCLSLPSDDENFMTFVFNNFDVVNFHA